MVSSVLERFNVVPVLTKSKNETERIKVEIDEIEKGRIRAIQLNGGISF